MADERQKILMIMDEHKPGEDAVHEGMMTKRLCPRCKEDYLRMEKGDWARGGCEWIEDNHDNPLRTDYPFVAKFWCSCGWETPLYKHDDKLPILDFEAEAYSWLNIQIGLAEKNNEHALFAKAARDAFRELLSVAEKYTVDKIVRGRNGA